MSDQSDNQPQNPFAQFDLTNMLKQMQVPGINVEELVENQRKNIEAVQQANQAVAEGWATLANRQAEIFRESMERTQQAISESLAASPQQTMESQAANARQAFDTALQNMQELAQIAAESQQKAAEIMRQRVEENLKNLLNPGS